MSTEVDLGQLAIDRSTPATLAMRRQRHVMSRYVLPGAIVIGFLSLISWAVRDLVFPPQPVTVVPVYATQTVVREGTPLFRAAGWIEPRPTPVRAAALTEGVISELLVVEDQLVKAGEAVALLVRDDAVLEHKRSLADLKLREAERDDCQVTLAAARTRLAQPVHLEAALGESEAGLAKMETLLANLPFELQRAASRLDFARKDYEGKVAADGAIAGRIIDEAKSEWEAAAALVEELRGRKQSLATEQKALVRRRDALKTQLMLLADEKQAHDSALAKLAAAAARMEQATVAVAIAKLRLDRITVRSPIDGRVYQLIGHPGARIGSGMTQMQGHDGSTVVTLYRPEMLQVRVDVRFEDIPKVQLGQSVWIENPAIESALTGHVLFVSSEADIQKNTLEVKVAIASPPPVFKPEMLVDVTFLAPKEKEQDRKPSEEMLFFVEPQLVQQGEGGTTFVWVADQSAGVARQVTVQTGSPDSNGLIHITGALTASSRIIASGFETLANGDRIQVTGEMSSRPAAAPASNENMSRRPTGEI